MEQEFPSFLMESYVQEKLLICTWKHTGFAFCFSTNTVLAYIRKISGNKWVIPRVYYKSCGASTSQSDSYSQTLHYVDFCPDLPIFIPFTGVPDWPGSSAPRVPLAQPQLPRRILGGALPCPVPQPGSSRDSSARSRPAREWDLGGWPRPGAGPWNFGKSGA